MISGQAQKVAGSNAMVTRFDDIAGIERSKLQVPTALDVDVLLERIWGFPKMVVPNNHGFSY